MYQKIDPVVAESANQFRSHIKYAAWASRATTGLERAAALAEKSKKNIFDMPLAALVRHGYANPEGFFTDKGYERCTTIDWDRAPGALEPFEAVSPVVFVDVDGPQISDPSEFFDQLTWNDPMWHPCEEAAASASSFAQSAAHLSGEPMQTGPDMGKVVEAFAKANATPEQARKIGQNCLNAATVAYSKTKDFVRENPKSSMAVIFLITAGLTYYMLDRMEKKKVNA